MITEKMEGILTKASRSLQQEVNDTLDVLPKIDAKRVRQIIESMEDLVAESGDERYRIEKAAAASAGATATVAPPAKIAHPVSELQERAEILYPGMQKRPRK
jgi:hypothetical protein